MEMALWAIGISLFGVALGATLQRSRYQATQERVIERRMATSQRAADQSSDVVAPVVVDSSAGSGAELELRDVKQPSSRRTELPGEERASSKRAQRKPASSSEVGADPDLLGRIEIPRVGLTAIVRKGDDEATLERAVGWVPGTTAPGAGGNTALAGHRDTFFRSLQRVKVADRIRLTVPPLTYEYRIDSLRVVPPEELSVLASSGTEELTLVTCYPFHMIGPAPDRFIVKATRVR